MKTNSYVLIVVFAIVAELVILSFFNYHPLITSTTTAYAQSQPQSKQQQSQASHQQKPQTGTRYIFNQKKSKPANGPESCVSLASVVSGKGIPDYNLSDIVVYRQAPAITRSDGLVLEEIKFVYIQ
jgi:hypothetical protein